MPYSALDEAFFVAQDNRDRRWLEPIEGSSPGIQENRAGRARVPRLHVVDERQLVTPTADRRQDRVDDAGRQSALRRDLAQAKALRGTGASRGSLLCPRLHGVLDQGDEELLPFLARSTYPNTSSGSTGWVKSAIRTNFISNAQGTISIWSHYKFSGRKFSQLLQFMFMMLHIYHKSLTNSHWYIRQNKSILFLSTAGLTCVGGDALRSGALNLQKPVQQTLGRLYVSASLPDFIESVTFGRRCLPREWLYWKRTPKRKDAHSG